MGQTVPPQTLAPKSERPTRTVGSLFEGIWANNHPWVKKNTEPGGDHLGAKPRRKMAPGRPLCLAGNAAEIPFFASSPPVPPRERTALNAPAKSTSPEDSEVPPDPAPDPHSQTRSSLGENDPAGVNKATRRITEKDRRALESNQCCRQCGLPLLRHRQRTSSWPRHEKVFFLRQVFRRRLKSR